jgi:hypothetical protein
MKTEEKTPLGPPRTVWTLSDRDSGYDSRRYRDGDIQHQLSTSASWDDFRSAAQHTRNLGHRLQLPGSHSAMHMVGSTPQRPRTGYSENKTPEAHA